MTPMGEIATAMSRDLCGRHCTGSTMPDQSMKTASASASVQPVYRSGSRAE